MRPLISEVILTQHSGDLTPVPDAVQENIGRDLVFVGSHRSSGQCLEGENLVELALFGSGEEIDELRAGEIAELKYVFDRSLSKFVPLSDALVAQSLNVTQLDSENVVHHAADGRHATAGERNGPGVGMRLEPVVPAMLLGRCELEEQLVGEGAAVDGAHTRR